MRGSPHPSLRASAHLPLDGNAVNLNGCQLYVMLICNFYMIDTRGGLIHADPPRKMQGIFTGVGRELTRSDYIAAANLAPPLHTLDLQSSLRCFSTDDGSCCPYGGRMFSICRFCCCSRADTICPYRAAELVFL